MPTHLLPISIAERLVTLPAYRYDSVHFIQCNLQRLGLRDSY